MKIHDEMNSLGEMGGKGYQPSDDVVAGLLQRTRRVRTLRQGAVTVAGAVGAFALGTVAVQAINATEHTPAVQDQNVINDGKGVPVPSKDTKAPTTPDKVKPTTTDAVAPDAEVAPEPSEPDKVDVKDTGKDKDPTTCVTSKPEWPHKTFDCKTGEWKIKADWFWDGNANDYVQCSAQHSYPGGYYDCSKKKWVANAGYVEFDGRFWKVVSILDTATGTSASGVYLSDWGKIGFMKSGEGWIEEYKYLDGKASMSGNTCTGTTMSTYGATFQFSCMPENRISADNGSGGKVGKSWILTAGSSHLKWHSGLLWYHDPANPPAGWVWDSGQGKWVAAPPVTTEP